MTAAQASNKFEILKIGTLTPNPQNARIHSERQIAALAESMRLDGFHTPIIVAGQENRILCGHGRVLAAKKLGLKSVPARRMSGLTRAQETRLMVADNRISDAGEEDPQALRALLAEIIGGDPDSIASLDSMGFTEEEVEDSKAIVARALESAAPPSDADLPPAPGETLTHQGGDYHITREASESGFRSPIVYHGGKAFLVPYLLPILKAAAHTTYAEVFAGGLALFWARVRQPGQKEFVNDKDGLVVNFWRVLQSKFAAFADLARDYNGLHSEALFREARAILAAPGARSDVEQAWALFYAFNLSYSHMGGKFAIYPSSNSAAEFRQRIERLTGMMQTRLRGVTISDGDALKLIPTLDRPTTLFYCDPPYPATDQRAYGDNDFDGEAFTKLLTILARIKGKFILSSLPHAALAEFTEKFRWAAVVIETPSRAGLTIKTDESGRVVMKREVITTNFTPAFGGGRENGGE